MRFNDMAATPPEPLASLEDERRRLVVLVEHITDQPALTALARLAWHVLPWSRHQQHGGAC